MQHFMIKTKFIFTNLYSIIEYIDKKEVSRMISVEKNNLKKKVSDRQKTIGTHINLNDIAVGKIAALAGYDFIWIDLEHSYLSYENLLNLIIAVHSTGGQVIVRAPQNDLTATKKILEMGPDGIIFPMVKTAEETNRLISYTLYPPYGTRGFGPMNAINYGFDDVKQYIESHHETMCRFIQIEHIEAVKNLDELIKNNFIDGYIVGANDLSGSIGKLGDVFCHEVTSLIQEIVQKLKSNGKYVGISTGDFSEATLTHWHNMGFDMISAGADFDFLREGFRQNCSVLKEIHLK